MLLFFETPGKESENDWRADNTPISGEELSPETFVYLFPKTIAVN